MKKDARTLIAQLLVTYAHRVGDPEGLYRLARRLNVKPETIGAWVNGLAEPISIDRKLLGNLHQEVCGVE